MMGRRPPGDGDSSRREALPEYCHQIGPQLIHARARRQLSVEDIALALLLSRNQVIGLERADASAFYGRAYFLKALQKYMDFAGVSGVVGEDDGATVAGGLRMTLACPPPTPVSSPASSRRLLRTAVIVLATVIAAVLYGQFGR
jgi:hypothetical protein